MYLPMSYVKYMSVAVTENNKKKKKTCKIPSLQCFSYGLQNFMDETFTGLAQINPLLQPSSEGRGYLCSGIIQGHHILPGLGCLLRGEAIMYILVPDTDQPLLQLPTL